MKQKAGVQDTIAMAMAGSVRLIGLSGKWGGMTPAVRHALTKLVGLVTESAARSRSGATRNDERRYADADGTWQTTL